MSEIGQQSSETYAIGEVAIYVNPGSDIHEMEVTVIGPLEYLWIRDECTGVKGWAWCYPIDTPTGPPPGAFAWRAEPRHLRKRRPPPDWNKLCALNWASTENLIEEQV